MNPSEGNADVSLSLSLKDEMLFTFEFLEQG
jgi:hypothetical protein